MGLLKTDEEKALEFYEKAEEYYKNKEYEKMIPYYEKAAELGHLQSIHCLGYSYKHGEGVEVNYKKAYEWYSIAAAEGYVKSIFAAGLCLYNGEGVTQNKEQGFKDMENAAMEGYVPAMYKVGELYYTGDCRIKREKVGISYIAQAAAAGNKKAVARLCEILSEDVFVEDGYVQTEYSQALYESIFLGDYSVMGELIALYKEYGFLHQSDRLFEDIVKIALEYDAEAADSVVKYLLQKDSEMNLYVFFLRLFEGKEKLDAHNEAFNRYVENGDRVAEDISKYIDIIKKSVNGGRYSVISDNSFCCGCSACADLLDATGYDDLRPEFNLPQTRSNKLKYYVAESRCGCFNILVEEI